MELSKEETEKVKRVKGQVKKMNKLFDDSFFKKPRNCIFYSAMMEYEEMLERRKGL